MKEERVFGCMFVIWLVGIILSLAITILTVYAAAHFIMKFW